MNSFFHHQLQPLANLSSMGILTLRLQQMKMNRRHFHVSTICRGGGGGDSSASSISSNRKQGRVKRKKKLHPALQLLEVPDYLIPLAYRQQQHSPQQQQPAQQFHPRQILLDEGTNKGTTKHHHHSSSNSKSKRGGKGGGGFASLFSRSSSSPTHHGMTHANHPSSSNFPSSSRHRRKSGSHPHTPSSNSFQSTFADNTNKYNQPRCHQPMDVESLRQLENSLNEKMSEYIRIHGGSGSGSGSECESTATVAAASATTSATTVNTPVVVIPMDKEFYHSVVMEYHAIILGWCEVAESICLAQQEQRRIVLNAKVSSSFTEEGTDGEDEEDDEKAVEEVDLLSRYEDAMCRAMRHLDSLESLYRTNGSGGGGNIIDPSKRMMEREMTAGEGLPGREAEGPRGMTVMDDIASMGNIFFGPKRDTAITVTGDSSSISKQQQLDSDKKNSDVHLITSLYEHILLAHHSSSFCFGGKVQRKSTNKSNQLLKKWITLYCCSSSSPSSLPLEITSKSTTNLLPDTVDNHPRNHMQKSHGTIHSDEDEDKLGARNIFHTVLRQNIDLSNTIEGVKQAEYWLSSMHSLSQVGYSNCAPDVDAYNLVLLGYCNLCKTILSSNRSNNSNVDDKRAIARRRQFIVEGVERVLLQLAECKDESCRVNITSLNLALNAIAKAGRHSPDSNCQTTNSLLLKLLGEEKYLRLVQIESHDEFNSNPPKECVGDPKLGLSDSTSTGSDAPTPILNLEPNLDTYHWLVDIYSNSTDITNTMRSLSLLRKMIQIRNRESQTSSASFAPSTGTHCKVLRALLARVDDLSEYSIANIAKEMTQNLDSMVLYGSSLPNHVVYLYLLQLWQKSRSPEAGQYAEEILSRMEISEMYQNDLKISSGPYFIALSCWLTSAIAGRSDAAERAYR
jgi:hypothetical protein